MDGFEMILVNTRSKNDNCVVIRKAGKAKFMCISTNLIQESGMKSNDRVDLLYNKEKDIFAIEKRKAGLYTIFPPKGNSKQYKIYNSNLCIEVLIRSGKETDFTGKAEEGVILFWKGVKND